MKKSDIYNLFFTTLSKNHYEEGNKVLKNTFTHTRRSVILPYLVGKNILVYNGKKYTEVLVTENMVMSKLGEYAPTRKTTVHKKKNKK